MIGEVTAAVRQHLRHFLPVLDTTAPGKSIAEIDREIQNYAFQSFNRSRTGDIYTVTLPSNLTGLKVEAVRLRSGSLRRHGLIFNEFSIPAGASVDDPNQERVLLIYREFTGLKIYFPERYTLVSPVLGIKIYSAANLSTPSTLPELHLTATGAPVTVRIPFFTMVPGSTPLCASLGINGSLSIRNVSSPPNVCSSSHVGDFSLVTPSGLAPAPAPELPHAPQPGSSTSPISSLPPSPGASVSSEEGKPRRNAWKIALGSALAAFTLLVVMAGFALMVAKSIDKTRIAKMEYESERGETLHTALIGNSRAPTAGSARTRPSLENDYTP
ncbi:hypothetical protein O6H91_Y205500 [Diphasiastrum complanatum]|nr:hypothetical protein O6H91_Y205500 [Diphasiastrum complanatum]